MRLTPAGRAPLRSQGDGRATRQSTVGISQPWPVCVKLLSLLVVAATASCSSDTIAEEQAQDFAELRDAEAFAELPTEEAVAILEAGMVGDDWRNTSVLMADLVFHPELINSESMAGFCDAVLVDPETFERSTRAGIRDPVRDLDISDERLDDVMVVYMGRVVERCADR